MDLLNSKLTDMSNVEFDEYKDLQTSRNPYAGTTRMSRLLIALKLAKNQKEAQIELIVIAVVALAITGYFIYKMLSHNLLPF
jgi:hypothetical protein